MIRRDRRLLFAAGALTLCLGAAVVPALGAPGRQAAPAPEAAAPSNKPDKVKTPEIDVTVTGTVTQGTDGKGRPTFAITANGTTWTLSAGPSWFWGDDNPLEASVGTSVTVAGSHHEGSTDLSVDTVDGKALRAAGKPPWAGGPFVVGATHPGWKAWMADGKPGKGQGHGRENAPGQNKDKTGTGD
ncbi:MAG TPA: hypothetical protein VD763_05890 [Candidatus Saccharimonadales bacterium]|nr:hypothetical protein [Candidatus Saccharimonadales bacterium]